MAVRTAPMPARPQDAVSGGLGGVVEQLLALLATEAAKGDGSSSLEFRQQIERYRAEIAAARGSGEVARLGAACVESCRQYLAAMRTSVAEREAGYRELISLLRDGLSTLAAESGSFQADLAETSERVTALVRTDDIRVLKQELSREMVELKRAVVEKQQRDEVHQTQLLDRVTVLESTLAEVQEAATQDPVTSVANRGHFERLLARWVTAGLNDGKCFVLAMIDIDHFKEVNDTRGHQVGDRVLVSVARFLSSSVRPSDLVARYGGDEFALLLASITLEQAESRLTDLVARLGRTEAADDPTSGETLRVTISCGLAELGRTDTPQSIVQRADEALYAAKRKGRNCAVAKRPALWKGLLSTGR